MRQVVRAGGLGEYISQAAASIFTTSKGENEPPSWGDSGFGGEIAHHNEVAKLRRLHDVVVSTRQQIAGCMDPDAKNFNPDAGVDDGTCEFVFSDTNGKEFKGTIGSYITSALQSVMSGQLTNSDVEGTPANFDNTVFSYGGDKVSQRDIQRLLSFEKVVKTTLDKAESQIEEA